MYITINKKWFEANKELFAKESDDPENYQMNVENTCATVELNDENCEFYVYENSYEDNIYVSLDAKLTPGNVVEFVEQSMDDIHGDAFAKIIELMVKKLNKFKSFIESVRGL